jgi:hypothetical protein
MDFERKLPTEQQDIADIVAGILAVQARFARRQKRPLGRGTHTKGVCVRATLEVFDVAKTAGDPALAARLARGLFAKPGVYPATIRFANAASTFQKDSKPDVRALSFSLDVPAGRVGPEATRLDYSMNNATTFPINDAHDFAALMRVRAAGGGFAQLRALLSLSFKDLKGVFQTARKGLRQQRGPLTPYQQTRYWSNVPFMHGQDEAVKISARPAPDNAGRPIGKGENVLRDELARHLSEDPPARFDFAIQLLEPARMTVNGQKGRHVLGRERQRRLARSAGAVLHRGRLTLEPKSMLSDEDCQARFIDTTKFSLPDHRPIGSINRARWVAESASRKARLSGGALAPAARPSLVHRLGAITIGTVVKSLAVVAAGFALLAGALAVWLIVQTNSGVGMLPEETVDRVVYADQGWGAGVEAPLRQTYYYTAQGAVLKDVRYSWFLNLEMPWSTTKLSDPRIMRRYGFVVDGKSTLNPDGLPVGLTKHYDQQLNEELLDITCAACHTGQIEVSRNGRTTALRIDGGSALHAFTNANIGHFVPTLAASLLGTLVNPMKFNRFADAVLGAEHKGGRWALRRQMLNVAGQFGKMAYHEKRYGLVPTEEGYGRTDALARIANTVFGDHLEAENYAVGNAPVNYPPVWNIWKFDWVQYNASVSQPMARNIGEAMGTGAKYALRDRYGNPLPADQRFRSSAILDHLNTIELNLWKLQPPAWNEEVLGPIDRARAARGKDLFDIHCVSCHGPHIAPPDIKARNSPLKAPGQPEWIMKTLCVDDIGTDPNSALNFYEARVDITKTGMTADDRRTVARKKLTQWNQRETTRLYAEIARLKAAPGPPLDNAAQIAVYEKQIAGLAPAMEKQLLEIDPTHISVGGGLSYLGILIREKAYADLGLTPEQQADWDGFGRLDIPQAVASYEPRPLSGIWATAPFLHNGSSRRFGSSGRRSPIGQRRSGSGAASMTREKLGLATRLTLVFDTRRRGTTTPATSSTAATSPGRKGTRPRRA